MISESGSLSRHSTQPKVSAITSAMRGIRRVVKPASDQDLKAAVRQQRGVKAVQELLDAGADPNCRDYTPADKVGRGWDADYYPSRTEHVLAMAVRSKDVAVVRALLKAGADPSKGEYTGSSSFEAGGGNREDRAEYSQSPMDIARRLDLKDIVRELLDDKAAALSASTKLPEDMVEAIMDTQVASMQPTPVPETRVYNQWARCDRGDGYPRQERLTL